MGGGCRPLPHRHGFLPNNAYPASESRAYGIGPRATVFSCGLLLALLCQLTQAELPDDLIQQYRQDVGQWPSFEVDPGVNAAELGELQELHEVPWHTAETEKLGKILFFDPILSGSRQIACASCHEPLLGWTDGRQVSFGHDRTPGRRNSMTLLNAAHFDQLFWDGAGENLLSLIPMPIENPAEMNANLVDVIHRLENIDGYAAEFEQAFGTPEINRERMAQAIGAFIRTLQSRTSQFDRFVRGEYDQLSDQEIEGLHLFRTKARCMNCHHGPLFSDRRFHHTGLSYIGRRFEDLGRFYVTGEMGDRGKFRTPSLRDLIFTRPWMHNGLFTDFTGILRMYNHGITFSSRYVPKEPALSPLIKPLGLEKSEIQALEAFLKALSQHPRIVRPPPLPGRESD